MNVKGKKMKNIIASMLIWKHQNPVDMVTFIKLKHKCNVSRITYIKLFGTSNTCYDTILRPI